MAETFAEQVNRVTADVDVPETEPGTFADQVKLSEERAPVKQQSQENLSIAEGTNPDTEGKILKLSEESGYDAATVRVDPAKVENQLNSYKGGNDQLDDYYAKKPSNAAVSGDDWGPLEAVQRVMQSVFPTVGLAKAAVSAAQDFQKTETYRLLRTEELSATSIAKTIGASAALGITDISKAFGQTMDLVAPIFIDKRRLDFADKNLEKITVSADLEKWLRTKVGNTKFEELLSSAVESMGTMLAAVATGGESAVLPIVSYVAGIRKTTESLEGGATMTQALLAGAVSTGVEYWTEKIPIETMLDPAKKFLEKLVKGGIADIVGELTATAAEIFAIDQAILKKEHLTEDEIKQALYETAIVSLMMTSAGTTATHPFVKDKTIKPPVRKERGARRTLQERMEGAELTPLPEEATPEQTLKVRTNADVAPVVAEINRQEQTITSDKEFHQNLNDIRKAVGETKTFERSPTRMKEVLKSFDMTEDVFISSEGVKNLYQSHTDAEATEILKAVGADPVKARATIATGEDTVVQKATVVTLADERYNAISKDIKQAPASYTARELTDNKATENKQNSFVVLKENIDRSKKVNEEITRLTAELGSIENVKVKDKDLVQDAPLLLKGIADRLTLNGLDPVERLGNVSIKGTAFQEFVRRAEEEGTTLFQETLVKQEDKGPFRQLFGAVKDLITGKERVDSKQPLPKGATSAERLKAMEQKYKTFYQSAFHGSPFRFDKFSLEHLGKGEGAQAFGWGLYFAEKEDIAKSYRTKEVKKRKRILRAAGDKYLFKGTVAGELKTRALRFWTGSIFSNLDSMFRPDADSFSFLKKRTLADIDNTIERNKKNGAAENIITETVEARKIIADSVYSDYVIDEPKGATFKVELPTDDQILNWEKPLSEQSETVQKALSGLLSEFDFPKLDKETRERLQGNMQAVAGLLVDAGQDKVAGDLEASFNEYADDGDVESYISFLDDTIENVKFTLSGQKGAGDIVGYLAALRRAFKPFVVGKRTKGMMLYAQLKKQLGSDKAASIWLKDHGIKGHKYFDGDSRSAEEGTFNFVIYDDTAIDIVETFFQAQEGAPLGTRGTPRGALSIEGEKKTIELFEGADLSTVLHEIGHIALEEYSAVERAGLANQDLIDDMKVIREWVGAEDGADLDRKQSEQFARGFEAYLMEGKAPTTALRKAFDRFKQMLTSMYETAKALNVTLNDDIRAVFDRMLSANVEVEMAAQEAGFVAKTENELDALGMNDVDKFNAKKLIEQVKNKAEALWTKDRNKNLKKLTVQWTKEAKREIKRENPVYKTIQDIINDGNQLDRGDFIEAGQAEIADLPTRKLVKTDGENIDMVAALYEFDDAQTMIDTFVNTPLFTTAVEQRVEVKQANHDALFPVEDYFGDIKEYRDYQVLVGRYITGETVNEAEVDAAIQRNVKRWEKEAAKQIEKEFVALPSKAPQGAALDEAISRIVQGKIEAFKQRKAGAKAVSTDSLKRLARESIRAKTVRDAMNTRSFLSAMKRAASDERRAILKGDWGAASTANELGRYNYELVSLSGKVREEVKKILARSKKTGNSKSIEFAYQEAILHLISRYQLTKQVPTKPTIAPKYDELFSGDEFGYTTFPRPDFLDTNIDNYRDLRMEQLTELDNAINYLAGQGKEGKEGLLTTGEFVQDVADRSTEDMVGHKKVHEDYTTVGKLVGKSRAYFSTSDRMQNVMIAIGGYQNVGAKGESSYIETQTVDRVFVADNNEIELHARTREDLKPHFQTIQRSIRRMVKANKKQGGSGHKIRVDGAPVPEILRNRGKQPNWWTPENMFSIALNTGNPSNFDRLMSGYQGLTEEHIRTLTDQLTVEDMNAVQGIWKTMASLYNDMDAVFFKLNNYHLDKIEIEPFDFKGNHYEGGYYPAVYDASLSTTVAKREEALRIGKNENAKYQNPYLKSQFTKGRTGGGLPLRLKLNVVNQHFRDAIHYITHAEVVQDIDKIIQNPTFKEAAIDAIGEESYKTLRPSLAHVASPKIAGLEAVDHLVEKHRRLASAYMVLANAGISVKQSFSTGAAIFDVGVKDYALGVGLLMKDPIGRYRTMIDLSTKIKDRKNHFDREFSSLSKTFSPEQKQLWFGDKNISVDDIKAVLGWGVRTVDMMTITPAWTGAFEGRLKRNGGDTNEAVLYADNKIRKSQPSAAPIDLPYLQRAGGVIRLLSMFQTWWLKYAERQRLHYNAARKGTMPKSDYAWFTMIETIMPAIGSHMLMSLIWGRDLDDDEVQEDILKDTVTSLVVNAVPLGGTFFNPYGDPLDSPVGQGLAFSKDIMVDSAVYVFGDMTKKQKEQHEIRLMWDFFNVISFYSGIPASQVARKALKGSKQKQGLDIVKHLIPAPKNKQ